MQWFLQNILSRLFACPYFIQEVFVIMPEGADWGCLERRCCFCLYFFLQRVAIEFPEDICEELPFGDYLVFPCPQTHLFSQGPNLRSRINSFNIVIKPFLKYILNHPPNSMMKKLDQYEIFEKHLDLTNDRETSKLWT